MPDLARRRKPTKPYPSFPLTAPNNGQWCKKIRGKVHFFGVWADPPAALNRYLRVAADLHAGKQLSPVTLAPDDVTVKDICNYYLTHLLRKVLNEEIRPSTLEDCHCAVQSLASCVGSDLAGREPVFPLVPLVAYGNQARTEYLDVQAGQRHDPSPAAAAVLLRLAG
jgi:hypothetical protein